MPNVSVKHRSLALEKRQKRRESHNAVERRRRDNINDRITELATLLPECLLEGATPEDNPTSPTPTSIALAGTSPATLNISSMSLSTPAATPTLASSASSAAAKANKGIILAKSVDYIRYLQQLVELHSTRNAELERTVDQLRRNISSSDNTPSSTNSDDRSPREVYVSQHVGAAMNDPLFNEKFLISAARGDFGRGAEKWGFRNNDFDQDDDMDG